MAQNQMYNPTQAALYGPDLLARQLRLQQSQQFGQQMLEQGQQAPQGQMVSGHYVAPSITQYLSQGLKSYAGRKAMDDLPNQMAGIAQAQQEGTNRMFGIGQPSPQALATGLGGQPQGAPMQSPAGQSQMPLLPGRSAQESARLFALMGSQEYVKQVATQGAPTDIQKNLIGQGIQPGSPQWNQALGDSTFKAGYVAPTSAAPGATLVDPRTGRPTFNAPQNGIQTQYGPNGEATAAAVPGYSDANAGIQGAEAGAIAGAKAKFNLVSVPNGNGGADLMPEDQAAERLRNTGGQGASQSPNQPTGFGKTPSPVSLEAAKTLNNNWISGTYQPVIDNSNAGRSLIGTITAMRNIPLETGFGTEMKGAAANLLTSLGVKDAAKIATDVQKFQSLAMDRLQTELMKQKGPQTEGDAIRAGQTFARLGNTPEANKFIFDYAQAKANMDIRKAEFYQAALPIARREGDLTEIDRRWQKVQGSLFDDPILSPYGGNVGGGENGNP